MSNLNREYQTILIVNPELAEADISKLQGQVGELVGRHQGRVVESVSLGRRRLSYKMGRFTEATYLQMKLELPPLQLSSFERALKMVESVIRFLVLKDNGSLGDLKPSTEETPLPHRSEVRETRREG